VGLEWGLCGWFVAVIDRFCGFGSQKTASTPLDVMLMFRTVGAFDNV
jgi:hypothetical protein